MNKTTLLLLMALFSVSMLVGMVLEINLELDISTAFTQETFYRILLKEAVISAVITAVLYFMNRKRIQQKFA